MHAHWSLARADPAMARSGLHGGSRFPFTDQGCGASWLSLAVLNSGLYLLLMFVLNQTLARLPRHS